MQIQFRRDTAANWTANNTLLASGEIGLETDTNKLKMGTGLVSWNSLAYFAAGAVTAVDAGGFITVDFGGTKLFKIDKTTGDLLIAGGLITDETL